MNPAKWTNEMWAFAVLLVGVGTLVLCWHTAGKGDVAIASGIIGAALNKFTSKGGVPDPQALIPKA